jgi:transcription elongation factor Elf1
MGNNRNRKRKRARKPPSKAAKKFKDGGPYVGNDEISTSGPSGAKIGDQSANFGASTEKINTEKTAGTIFMDLSVLFGVFDDILKCPECGSNTSSHVDMKKKNGFSTYVVLECQNLECEWKYCFNTRAFL